jgi:hypothetical protein
MTGPPPTDPAQGELRRKAGDDEGCRGAERDRTDDRQPSGRDEFQVRDNTDGCGDEEQRGHRDDRIEQASGRRRWPAPRNKVEGHEDQSGSRAGHGDLQRIQDNVPGDKQRKD